MRFAAALDPPGETKRQALTLVLWMLFLGAAVIGAAEVGTHVPASVDPLTADPASSEMQAEVHRSLAARFRIALVLGLLAPGVSTLLLSRRYRRNGAHARGISVELTPDELRLWGRGYGTRVAIRDSTLEERLVDVYAGRLGAWRQVRLRLRAKHQALELAAPAREGDGRELRLEGGEADCVEISREDYDALRAEILARKATPPPPHSPSA
jgi:hypothetical protein